MNKSKFKLLRLLNNQIESASPASRFGMIKSSLIIVIIIILFLNISSLAQYNQVPSYSFSSGFAISNSANTTGISSVGESFCGISSNGSSIITSGFLASTSSIITDVAGEKDVVPNVFDLHQNYPNPFNPSTVISWQIPVSSHVSLKVYDILGNEVATLVNENKETGFYETKFDGSSLASGMYIYRLTAGNYISTKKMLMIK